MAEAARNFVIAFKEAGAEVSTEFVPNLTASNNLGKSYQYCLNSKNKDIPYGVKIIHVTPDVVRSRMEPPKGDREIYHIFHLFWETDKLPLWWVWELNHSVDEVWTGSVWNKETFQRSGVKVPIYIFPQPCAPIEGEYRPFSIPGFNGFIFGSIFQWHERKDPKTLLTAYWKEFQRGERVALILKTYKETFQQKETDQIIAQIKAWKKELGLPSYPKTYLLPDCLARDGINRFYATVDCYVTSARGEGWGIPVVEAMQFGKPVISIDLGGCTDHVPKDYWYPVKHTMIPVFNMNWVPWYGSDQLWGQIDEESLRHRMREVFEGREEAKRRGQKAKEFVGQNFGYQEVGNRMLERLEQI